MITNRYKFFYSASTLITLTFLIIGSCSSPKVQNAILSPEAKKIQVWKVELATDTASTGSDSLITDLRVDLKSKFVKKEYCAPYINEVEDDLRALGYHVVDGKITEGTIRLDIKGKKEKFWSVGIGARNGGDEEREWDTRGDPTEGHLSGKDVLIDTWKFLESDEIRSVKIEFFSLAGKSLGSATIKGGKIKPDFVAKAIDRMIKEGKY
jgi:hypothetical protein